MIESRYKIEYVLPDEKTEKTSPFRVLWYLFLIPLILLAVTAITYDFSLQKIKQDSTLLINKTKVHVLNLGDEHLLEKTKEQSQIVKKTNTEKAPLIKKSQESKTLSVKAKIEHETNKKIITELTAKQKLQLQTIQNQTTKNTELNKDITSLSKQLTLEKTINEALNSKLSAEEKDRLELEAQLNQLLTEAEKNKTKLKNQVKNTSTIQEKPTISPSADITAVAKIEVKEVELKEIPVKTNEIIETTENKLNDKKIDEPKIVSTISDQTIENSETKNTEKSDTDKIIETMVNIKKSNEVITKTNDDLANTRQEIQADNLEEQITTEEGEVSKENDVVIKSKEKTNINIFTLSTLPALIVPVAIEQPLAINNNKDETKTEKINSEEEPTQLTPELEIEKEVIAEQEPKPNSAVDDIIAAMQSPELQPKQISDSENSKQDIDPELEKEIKKQLVEQGDIKIDN